MDMLIRLWEDRISHTNSALPLSDAEVAWDFNARPFLHGGSGDVYAALHRDLIKHRINNDLCNKFSTEHYPMLFWGPPSKFVSGSWDPKKENSGLREIDDGRTADRLLNWINKQLGSSYTLTDEKFKNEHVQNNASDPAQISRAIYNVEEATATAFDIIISS